MKFYDVNNWNEVFLKYHYLFNTDNNDGTSQSLQSLSSLILLNNLKSIEKSDIFRYLITYIHGGIYSDIDVTCLQPIKQWLHHYPSINITTSLDQLDFIFGIEFSRKQVQYKHIGKMVDEDDSNDCDDDDDYGYGYDSKDDVDDDDDDDDDDNDDNNYYDDDDDRNH